MEAARSAPSPALRIQDQFLQSNPQIDYRLVLPSGSQDVGVMFSHPMGKCNFKIWRSMAPEPPYVHRMYELLAESQPSRTKLIRKQLRAEYGVDPLSDEAKRTNADTMPTGQQMVDSLSPDMIFYPEKALQQGEVPSGASVRGTVGHTTMFEVHLRIYEERIQTMLIERAQSGRPVLFGQQVPTLLALLDGGIAQGFNEAHRAESTTLVASEKLLKSQLTRLEYRVQGNDESFLFIPMEALYCNCSHKVIKSLLSFMLMGQADLIEKIMQAYTDARFWTHKKGPHPPDGSRPPASDLVGPCEFNASLRLQCAMSSAIAMTLIATLLKVGTSSCNSDAFIFPHALIFSSLDKDSGEGFTIDALLKRFESFEPILLKSWVETWCTSGNSGAATKRDGIVVKHVGSDQFIDRVRTEGCSWYPLFSDKPDSTL